MLELVAAATMIADHVGKVFFPDVIALQIIGRFSFIIYAYFIAVGYQRTSSAAKYFLRILAVAALSQFFYARLFGAGLNTCFTLSAGILSLMAWGRKTWAMSIRIALLLCLSFIALFFGFDYGMYGILVIFIFHVLKDKNKFVLMGLQTANTIICIFVFAFHWGQAFSILAYPLIAIVNTTGAKTKLRWPKHMNYLVYPVHLAAIYLVAKII